MLKRTKSLKNKVDLHGVDELTRNVYHHIIMQTDPVDLFAKLREMHTPAEIDTAYRRAHEILSQSEYPDAPIALIKNRAAYSLVYARSLSVCDYKTAKSAIDSKNNLDIYLDENFGA
jgi:hypothetical protein